MCVFDLCLRAQLHSVTRAPMRARRALGATGAAAHREPTHHEARCARATDRRERTALGTRVTLVVAVASIVLGPVAWW